MKTEKFKVTPLERAWILYDVGNSAFVLMIATLARNLVEELLCSHLPLQ